MLRLSSKINIYLKSGLLELNDFLTELEIESSFLEFTDKLTLRIPKKVSFEGKPIASGDTSIFNVGDKIEVYIGYDDVNDKVFTGYITKVNVNFPITIECEDSFYLLKNNSHLISEDNISLKNLLKKYLPSNIKYKTTLSCDFKKLRIPNAVSSAGLLKELKKNHGIYSFFRDEVLYVGLAIVPELKKEHIFQFGENIIDGNDLEFVNENDMKVLIKCIGIKDVVNAKGKTHVKKVEVQVGDPDGDVKTFHNYSLSESDLKTFAKNELGRAKFTGFVGSFKSFGIPFVQHSHAVRLRDSLIPDRNGLYIIKKVVYEFGIGKGWKQIIHLDIKIG